MAKVGRQGEGQARELQLVISLSRARGRAAATGAQRDFRRDLKVNRTLMKMIGASFPTRGWCNISRELGEVGTEVMASRAGRTLERTFSKHCRGRGGRDIPCQQHLRGKEIFTVRMRIKTAWKNSSLVELRDS